MTRRLRTLRPPLIGLAVAIAVGVALRLTILMTSIGRMEADEAVTGIMAQRILDGSDLYAFFAGQTYMGSLEQYPQALVLAILPDSPLSLRLVQLALSVACMVLVFVAGRRITESQWGGVLAAGIFAVGAYYNLDKGIRSHGAYATAQCLTVATLLLALRLADDPRRPRRVAFAVGLCGGLAIWESALAFLTIAPVVVWSIGLARGRLRSLLPPAALGALTGSFPLIIHRLIHGPFPPSGTGTPPPTTFAERIDNLLNPILGMFTGVRRLGDGLPVSRWLPPGIVLMVILGILGALVWHRRDRIWALLCLRGHRAQGIDAVLVGLLAIVIPYGLTDYTWFTGEPRYLFALYPFAAILVAYCITRLPTRPAIVLGLAVTSVSLTLSLYALRRAEQGGGTGGVADGGRVYTEDVPAVANWLTGHGVTGVRANYWLAYPLQFAGGDRFAVAPYTDDRFPALTAQVNAARRIAYATTAGPGADRLAKAITTSRATATRTTIGRIVVFTDIDPPRTPVQLGLPLP